MIIKEIFRSKSDCNYFFGYYDKFQFNENNNFLLACRSSFYDRMPNKKDSIEIGYFDINNPSPKFEYLTRSHSFNWQQGCMLSWFSDHEIIFNDYVRNKYVSVLFNIINKKRTILSDAIYCLSKDNSIGVSIDFERQFWFRKAYSYSNIINTKKKIKVKLNDSIKIFSIMSGKLLKSISIKEIINFLNISYGLDIIQYFEHIIFSPCNNKLAFLFRTKLKDGELISKLLVYDLRLDKIILVNKKTNRLTHYNWIDEFRIIAWCGSSTSFNKLRSSLTKFNKLKKTLIRIYKFFIKSNSIYGNNFITKTITGDSYKIFNLEDSEVIEINDKLLNKDGHPSVNPSDKTLILTDTYPNEKSFQDIIIYDIKNNKTMSNLKFCSNIEIANSPIRCDLHPRWSNFGNFFSIDQTINGNRGISLYKINDK